MKCDIFTGEWVADPSGPRYTNETCHVIESHQNCMKNGRPDSAYFYWRWNPRDCDLPKFNAHRFLALMRNKSWAFIGDSISRNHVQSLLCSLSPVHFKPLQEQLLLMFSVSVNSQLKLVGLRVLIMGVQGPTSFNCCI